MTFWILRFDPLRGCRGAEPPAIANF